MTLYRVLRVCWYNIVLNAHARTAIKGDESKEIFNKMTLTGHVARAGEN
jgi:hypothetical protein